jgi:hypothetical protein
VPPTTTTTAPPTPDVDLEGAFGTSDTLGASVAGETALARVDLPATTARSVAGPAAVAAMLIVALIAGHAALLRRNASLT